MCFRELVVAAQWNRVDSWEDKLETRRHVNPARDHEVLLVHGSADREGEKGLAKRCEGGPAECQGVERTLGSTGLAPSRTKCVTLGKLFNPNFSLQ